MASLRRYVGRVHGSSGRVHVGLLLELSDVFLIPDSLVSEPVGNLLDEHTGKKIKTPVSKSVLCKQANCGV